MQHSFFIVVIFTLTQYSQHPEEANCDEHVPHLRSKEHEEGSEITKEVPPFADQLCSHNARVKAVDSKTWRGGRERKGEITSIRVGITRNTRKQGMKDLRWNDELGTDRLVSSSSWSTATKRNVIFARKNTLPSFRISFNCMLVYFLYRRRQRTSINGRFCKHETGGVPKYMRLMFFFLFL